MEKVKAYWERAGYSFPVLVDSDDSLRVAYRAATIPVTVVIGMDGVIHGIHRDASPGLDTWLMDVVTGGEGAR